MRAPLAAAGRRKKKLSARLRWEHQQAQPRPPSLFDSLDQALAPAAPSPDELTALAAWRFCAGWAPERLPVFAAWYDLPDPELTLDLMAAIRDTLAELNA